MNEHTHTFEPQLSSEDYTNPEYVCTCGTVRDKKQLLQQIEQLELKRLNSLSYKEIYAEYLDWFNERPPLLNDSGRMVRELLTDFMSYRVENSEQELLVMIQNYANN